MRKSSELEMVEAENYDLNAKGVALIRAENTFVTATSTAKINAEQIQIG
jgi:hypothetical protein